MARLKEFHDAKVLSTGEIGTVQVHGLGRLKEQM